MMSGMNAVSDQYTESNAISVGVLFSQSGPMSTTEIAHLKGTLLAIHEINDKGGVNGKIISPVIEDPASIPSNYRESVKKLIRELDISIFFGCCSSASRKAVLPTIERQGALLFYPSFYEGFEYSPNIIYTGATPNQTVLPLAEYLFQNFGKRFYLVGSDYLYPREINRIMSEFLAESGGHIVGENYITLGAAEDEFRLTIEKIKNEDVSAIISTVVGNDTEKLYHAYFQAGLPPQERPIASLTTSESELFGIAKEAREGHFTSASYFASLNSKESMDFCNLYATKYGNDELPSVYAETAYMQVHLFAMAASVANNYDAEIIQKVIMSSRINSPQGTVVIDSENNHIFATPYIGKSTKAGAFNIVWGAENSVKPDPYLLAYDRKISS